MKTLRLGIIGGGLMGREMASAIGRWCALTDVGVRVELAAVCDLAEKTRCLPKAQDSLIDTDVVTRSQS